jgi:hypothetical protein
MNDRYKSKTKPPPACAGGGFFVWWPGTESNHRHADFQLQACTLFEHFSGIQPENVSRATYRAIAKPHFLPYFSLLIKDEPTLS